MKNLKKVGAVALAAVMAVTFAPVASLNVFASKNDGTGEINPSSATTLDAVGKKWKINGTVDDAGTITVEASCEIDLNGVNTADDTNHFDINVVKGATLTLTDSSVNYNADGTVKAAGTGKAKVVLGVDDTDDNGKDDTQSGNLIVKSGTVTSVTFNKGTLKVQGGEVNAETISAIGVGTDATAKSALRRQSSITVEGGKFTLSDIDGILDATGKGEGRLNPKAGIKISGGEVTFASGTDEFGADGGALATNKNGDLVNISGGYFPSGSNLATYTAQNTVSGESAKLVSPYLNTNAEKALPIAKDGSNNFYVGNKAITAGLAKASLVVVNGDASVSSIESTANTIMNDVTFIKTDHTLKGKFPTVTATAADGYSTMKQSVETVVDSTKRPVQTTYYFGAENIKAAVNGVHVPDIDADKIDIKSGAKCDEFRTALDITYAKDFNGNDEKAGTTDDVTFSATAAATSTGKGKGYTTNLVYFTTDPSSHVNETVGVGLIDDKYYVIDDNNANQEAYCVATKNVKILKATGWRVPVEKETTVNQPANMSFNVTTKVAPNVTGPDDTMVVIYNPTGTSDNLEGDPSLSPSATAYVFGKDTDPAPANDNTPEVNGVDVKKAEYIINNVVGDKLTITHVNKDVTIKAADGIDWWTTGQDTTADADAFVYTFAPTEKANEQFKAALYGYDTTEGVHVDAVIGKGGDTGIVRVSQGISGTYEDLDTGIKIDAEWAGGEQSSTLKADKSSRTWYVNLENKNLPRQVYRLRAKVGNNHLFTMDKDEADNAVASGDWVLENTNSFKMLPWNTNVKGAVKVLRFRNVRTNEFLYTTDPTEQANLFASADWAEGNVAFCGLDPESKEGYPVTRLNSLIGQGHLYSTAKKEVDNAVENDFYKQEGVAFWAVETPEKEK